jgi:hypothetical protein
VTEALPAAHHSGRNPAEIVTAIVLAGLAVLFLIQALFPLKPEPIE